MPQAQQAQPDFIPAEAPPDFFPAEQAQDEQPTRRLSWFGMQSEPFTPIGLAPAKPAPSYVTEDANRALAGTGITVKPPNMAPVEPQYSSADVAHPLARFGERLVEGAAGQMPSAKEAFKMALTPGMTTPGVGVRTELGEVPFAETAKRAIGGDLPGALGAVGAQYLQLKGGQRLSPYVQAGWNKAENLADNVGDKVNASDLGAKAKAVGKVGIEHAASKIPFAGSFFRRPSISDYLNAARTKATVFPREVQGPQFESGAFTPEEGEYVDTPPVQAQQQAPFAHAELNPRQLPTSGTVAREIPYRFKPGQIPAEDVNAPDANVLAARSGIRLTPRGLLNEAPELPKGIPPRVTGRAEVIDDQAMWDAMRNDLETEGRSARAKQSREFNDNNSMDVPKWKRQADAKAEILLRQAEEKAHQPVRYTTTKLPRPKVARSAPPSPTPTSDLSSALERTLKMIAEKKKK